MNVAYFPQVKNGNKLLGRVCADYAEPPREGYSTGPHVLEQNRTGAPQHAFQCYIYDAERRGGGEPPALRCKNTDNTFVPFDEQPDQQITDGEFVVWRLASLARGANGVGETRLERRALGLTDQTDE